ncbi:MAG: oligosaccharide flippase family protein [Parasphingorhabdus sp.]
MLKNISVSFVSTIYATLLSIIAVPVYLYLLGPDRYGLVGIFLLLQPIISLLDLGFGVTAMRESAVVKRNPESADHYRKLIRGLEFVFTSILMTLVVASIALSNQFALSWLKVAPDLQAEVILASALMLVTLSIRWMSILYRSCVNGFEAIAWLSGFNLCIATLRFVVVIPFMMSSSQSLDYFFGFQLAISLIEFTGFYLKARALMPKSATKDTIKQSLYAVKSVMQFTATISIGGLVWVGATQIDKIWLMNRLTLQEYGQYSLAVLLASGVSVVSTPINIALTPRLCSLHAAGNQQEFLQVYRRCTQIVAILTGSIVATISFFPDMILQLWTQLPSLPKETGYIFMLYAIGNGMLALSVFMHYLQISLAKLRLYVAGVLVFSIVFIMLLVLLVPTKGATGAAIAWISVNTIYLFVWTPFVHSRLIPELGWRWFAKDIGLIAAASVVGVYCVSLIGFPTGNWLFSFASLALAGCVALAASLLASSEARGQLMIRLPIWFQKLSGDKG